MPITARTLVDLILLGPAGDRRQLQDSPVLGDVWLEFAAKPAKRVDLLITPCRGWPAGPVAMDITKELQSLKGKVRKRTSAGADGDKPLVAYLQGLVAARLTFPELLQVIVPKTQWWNSLKIQDQLMPTKAEERIFENLQRVLKWAKAKNEEEKDEFAQQIARFTALDRYVILAGIILYVGLLREDKRTLDQLETLKDPSPIADLLKDVLLKILNADKKTRTPKEGRDKRGSIWQVSLNRKALPALDRSVPAVKGDAVHTLFKVNCERIRWAVLDSGIDGSHPAFKDADGKSRIAGTYDFRNIRRIVSLEDRDTKLKELLKLNKDRKKVMATIDALAADAENDRPIHWELVEDFIKVDPAPAPATSHGTHVAGIIGARATGDEAGGLCPDIQIYDFRVLGKTLEDTEFAIIAALQFIRYKNERNGFVTIHGANLSLSIPHDVRNFACGSTPICLECERLVSNGVVVVAAAGNRGYHSFETKEGSFDSYAAFSITDPGNAEEVITVGSTHRFRPHTYGVSFFSSRGPTGDGRLKPDIVAPGERIRSCLLGGEWGELDGTSMAAPHVCGAAAMLMARYPELIGHPRRIKSILCETATDLGRERSFQGHGMLDVLRAFQKI